MNIKTELIVTLGESDPSFTTVKKWVADFKLDRKSTLDVKRPGRPKLDTTNEIIRKNHKIIINNRRLKLKEVAECVDIFQKRKYSF